MKIIPKEEREIRCPECKKLQCTESSGIIQFECECKRVRRLAVIGTLLIECVICEEPIRFEG